MEKVKGDVYRERRLRLWRQRSGARLVVSFFAVLCLGFAMTDVANAAVVDGIADQNMPEWDHGYETSPFAEYFRNVWVNDAHIRLARYVVQWNAVKRSGDEIDKLKSWYHEVQELKLTPVLGLSNYAETSKEGNPSSSQYREGLKELLSRYPAPYVEAWNEPNGQGAAAAVGAAHYMNSAFSVCKAQGCTAIAGDFVDASGAVKYAEEYVGGLNSKDRPAMVDWGLHPYVAVNHATTTAREIKTKLLSADRLWITEVGAYYCTDSEQKRSAERLVGPVDSELAPAHVFYYEFMYKNEGSQPSCTQKDTALYAPPNDTPRLPAATVIYQGMLPRRVYRGPPGEPNSFLADATRENTIEDWSSVSEASAGWQQTFVRGGSAVAGW